MRKIINYFIALVTCALSSYAFANEQTSSIKPFAELLYWRAAETNSSYAMTINSLNNTINVIQSEPSFNTSGGVRAGLSYSPGDHFWDTKFYITHYTTHSSNGVGLGSQILSSLFFSGSYFISQDIFFGGYTDWNLTMNTVDLEISHAMHPTPTLTFSPKVGIKGASINQSINIDWNAFFYRSTEDLTNNFSGIGPSFGVDTKWNFFGDFSLVGDVSTALMYGQWNDSDVYRRPASFLTTATTISSHANNSKLGTSMMDYYLGFEWRHRGKSDVSVRLGYEGQYWPNQLRLIAVQQLRTFGDLTFQGATCRVTIDL